MDAATSLTQSIDPRIVPQPPRLHWAIVLVLSLLTRSLFSEVWLLVQANWIRRMTGKSEPMTWAIVNLAVTPFLFFSVIFAVIVVAFTKANLPDWFAGVVFGTVFVAVFALYVVTNFKMRTALEDAPIGIPLSGPMTFFFGAIYFQYHLHDYVVPDAVDVYGPIAPPPAYVPTAALSEPAS